MNDTRITKYDEHIILAALRAFVKDPPSREQGRKAALVLRRMELQCVAVVQAQFTASSCATRCIGCRHQWEKPLSSACLDCRSGAPTRYSK